MSADQRIVAIVPAAGLGVRMVGGRSAQGSLPPKQLLELDGVPILFLTLRKLAACPRLTPLIVAIRSADRGAVEARLAQEPYADRACLVEGGESRQESVANALRQVPAGTEFVLVHDAVRPFVELPLIERVIEAGEETGAAILGWPASDTIKQVETAAGGQPSHVTATIPRERIVLAQTPQFFRLDWLREAVERAAAEGVRASDEAMLVERLGHTVAVVMGSERNIKITTPADLELASFLLKREAQEENT
ncbi:MAG: 2-C-methyl-D-erythritol 4-phosphate cytidylyltransferase [Candidatus Acidiferrales bacterium]